MGPRQPIKPHPPSSDKDHLEAALQESEMFRRMLSVAMEKLHEADKRERYRRGKYVHANR